MRLYQLKGGPLIKCFNDKDCLFCEHCTDVFWDYSNGPYMIICDIGEEQYRGNCIYFKETEVIDNGTEETT